MTSNAPDWSHEVTFEASPICASKARDFVSQHLVEHRLLYLVDPVRLVASELATNALVHAQTAFNVTLAAWEKSVLLTVRDDSIALLARRVAEAMDLSGRGLEIVDTVALDWGTNEDWVGSKAVWASFALRAPREFPGRRGEQRRSPTASMLCTHGAPLIASPSGTRPRVNGAVESFTPVDSETEILS